MGCGRIAQRHSELLGNGKISGAKLVAVADLKLEKAQKLSDDFNVPAYQDIHEMMKRERPDAVTILTESGFHARNVIELAPYGADLVVEKPMALTLEDADKMINACDQNGVRLFVIKQNRFNAPVVVLKKAIDSGRFGKLVLGTVRVRWCRSQAYYDQDSWRGTWAYDGGALTNQASHHIDLLEWMMGDVESVFAKSITALVDIEAEDTGIVVLKFKNGALGVIEATTAARPKDLEGSISILGENGTVEIGGFAANEMKHWNFSKPYPEDSDIIEKYSVNPPNVYGFGHKAYYDHVVDCITNKKQALVDGLQGRKSIELISAIYQSIETNREIFLMFNSKISRLGKS